MTSKWHIETLCTFSPFPTPQEFQSLLGKIENISKLFSEVCSLDIENLPTPKLKYYSKKIHEYTEVEKIYTDLNESTTKFLHISSLENLYYICSSNKDKLDTVKTILKSQGNEHPSETAIRNKEKEIEKRVTEKFDGCSVKHNKSTMKYQKTRLF